MSDVNRTEEKGISSTAVWM